MRIEINIANHTKSRKETANYDRISRKSAKSIDSVFLKLVLCGTILVVEILVSLVGRIPRFHRGGPGSIPGQGNPSFFFFFFFFRHLFVCHPLFLTHSLPSAFYCTDLPCVCQLFCCASRSWAAVLAVDCLFRVHACYRS
jgi:hypothetical protein